MPRTVTAVFDDAAAAERARDALDRLGVPRVSIDLHRLDDAQPVPATDHAPGSEGGLPRLLDALFLPAEDLAAHHEAVRRGGTLVSATVPDALAERALRALEAEGAADLDARERDWRNTGWSPARMLGAMGDDGPTSAAAAMPGAGGMDPEAARQVMTSGARMGGERDALRAVRREPWVGRARSYVIETPLAEEGDAPGSANDAAGRTTGAA
jgi:hypothetical protein